MHLLLMRTMDQQDISRQIFSLTKAYSESFLTVLNGKNDSKDSLKHQFTVLARLASKLDLGVFVHKTHEVTVQPSSMVKLSVKERNPH